MEYIRTLTREMEVGERCDLRIENRAGTISVRGADTQQVRVEVVARLWADSDDEADDQVELIARGIQQDGDRVTVRAPALLRPQPLLFFFGRGPRVDYQVTVPRDTRATITSRSGRVEAGAIRGPLNVESRSGRVSLTDLGSDATVVARSGTVQAEGLGGSLSVDSRSGRVQVRNCKGGAELSARSGSMQVETVGGDLRIESRSGSVSVSDVGGALRVRCTSGSFRYDGPINRDFDIELVSGSVLLALASDAAFFLDAETVSGSVRSDLRIRRPAAGPSGRAAAPKLRVRTISGSIRLVPR